MSQTIKNYPHISNNYFVEFRDPSNAKWVNPLASYKKNIKPFIPKAEATFNVTVDRSTVIFCSDFFKGYYAVLDPKDLCTLSETSRGCYMAIKSSSIWDAQLRKILSHVTFLPQTECRFSPRHQFQILFKRIHDIKKPFQYQLQYNFTKIREFQEALFEHAKRLRALNISKEHRAYQMALEHGYLRELVGSNYNGSIESIDPKSLQGRCLNAFQAIDRDLNDQNTLKGAIFKSKPPCCLF